MIAGGNHSAVKSWLSVARPRGVHALVTDKPLRLTFVRHLPFQERQGGCAAAGGYEPPLLVRGEPRRFALGGYFSFKMNFITFRAQRWASAFVTPSGLFREATSVRSWISPGMSTSTWARMR